MKGFNLNEYDTVESRIQKFYKKYEDGRITVKVLHEDGDRSLIKAALWKSLEEMEKKCPLATGLAEETRDLELSTSKDGKKYESVNYTCHTENASTSAIGRALANLGFQGSKRPSREEMGKVDRKQGQPSRASKKQLDYLDNLITGAGKLPDVFYKEQGVDESSLTARDASRFIEGFLDKEEIGFLDKEEITPEEVEKGNKK